MYRDNPPDGAIPLLSEYAPMESESTTASPTLRAIRMFNVPTTVDPSGKLYMEQHLKIDRGGQSAPEFTCMTTLVVHLNGSTSGISDHTFRRHLVSDATLIDRSSDIRSQPKLGVAFGFNEISLYLVDSIVIHEIPCQKIHSQPTASLIAYSLVAMCPLA